MNKLPGQSRNEFQVVSVFGNNPIAYMESLYTYVQNKFYAVFIKIT